MRPHPNAAHRSWFYTAMGVVALLAVVVGFGRTYALPLAQGTFAGPRSVHVHGALAMAWMLLATLVLLWAGAGIVVEQSLETVAFDSPWWRATAHAIYRWLEGSGWV